MKELLTSPRSAALISLALVLPGALLISLVVLGIELSLGRSEPLLSTPGDQPDNLGSALAGSFLLLMPAAAFIIVCAPILRAKQVNISLFAHPINLILAVAYLLFITAVIGAIIADQYPCWIGVPNCD